MERQFSSTFDLFSWGFRYVERIQRIQRGKSRSTHHEIISYIKLGGKDRPGFVWKEKMDVKQRKARNYILKIQNNKDDKNDNENNLTVWDRLGWTKEKSPVCHNLDGFKQYNFTNCNVRLFYFREMSKFAGRVFTVHMVYIYCFYLAISSIIPHILDKFKQQQ